VKVDCTEQVTAGVIVRSGRMPPRRASAERFGVCSPSMRGVSPTTFKTSVRRKVRQSTRGDWPRSTELPSQSSR
jgi:hypothetical protein